MTFKPEIKTIAAGILRQFTGSALSATALALILFAITTPLAAPVRAQQIEANDYSAPSIGKRRPPSQTAIDDCTRWAMFTAGFNPGPVKMPPAWDERKPPSKSRQAAYNRWVGACLGQRESSAN